MVQTSKVQSVQETVERLGRAQSVVVVDYQGLTVAEISDLRGKLREAGAEMKVIKNRLTKRALAEANCDPLDEILVGPIALAFGFEDPVGPAKVCVDYAKGNDKLQLRGGLLEGKSVDLALINSLAKLPGRQELLTQFAVVLKSPARSMAMALQASVKKVVFAMKARADQLEEA